MFLPLSITFSPRQLRHLHVDVNAALDAALDFHFAHIRIGADWSEIESAEGECDFSSLKSLLSSCEKAHQKVVMIIGVKAPRWPEFHWPAYIPIQERNFENLQTQKKILSFIENTVREFRHFQCITHWQIENEPLDPSGPENMIIPREFLSREVALVRKLDERPIVLTLWGNTLSSRKNLLVAEPLADVIGIDVYYKQFMTRMLGKSFYAGPQDSDPKICKIIAGVKKPMWITELQAEPWEGSGDGYSSENPKSMSPELLRENVTRASSLGVQEIFLWGFEYWLWRKNQGDESYFEVVKDFFNF